MKRYKITTNLLNHKKIRFLIIIFCHVNPMHIYVNDITIKTSKKIIIFLQMKGRL